MVRSSDGKAEGGVRRIKDDLLGQLVHSKTSFQLLDCEIWVLILPNRRDLYTEIKFFFFCIKFRATLHQHGKVMHSSVFLSSFQTNSLQDQL